MSADSRSLAQERFAGVFEHLGLIVAYARRRDAQDPEAIAAEAMAIAWRRLAAVPADDPRPWLIATARNLLMAEHRRERKRRPEYAQSMPAVGGPSQLAPGVELKASLDAALRRLSGPEREALLLVAWEDLTPKAAAASLGISSVAFRARLYRARRQLLNELTNEPGERRLESTRAGLEGR